MTPISGIWLQDRAQELKASLAFCTRLPLARTTPEKAIAKAAWALPLAGLVVGLIGALVYALSHRLGLPAWPAAALTVAATLVVTGALHEDGLADTADGFGGGNTRQQKLDIMRDSRTGAYGVCALVLSLLLRVAALASLADTHAVVWALVGSHSAARATMPVLMWLLPSARGDGLSHDAGRPPGESVAAAAAIAFVVLLFCLYPGRAVIAALLLVAVIALMAWLSMRQIDGQTGDVVGALEQVAEIVVLLVAVA
ncbi:MAG TPA: adenosylcobinamide-GDP ribazoletransferase [Xanthobacteraceae bacterium]|jgi:adenosylcobinamide-GDP ribazoletransferase|nr:adenosylcobinamide-GDP ribazoletransferase [Xanthobacteraceae bacterium]